MPPTKNYFVDYTEDELMKMSHEEVTAGLSEKQQRFCEFFISSHNAKTAAIKAGYDVNKHMNIAVEVKKSKKIKTYIAWLKVRLFSKCMLKGEELLDMWTRIAFADMTDFVEILPHSIRIKPENQIDGQLVKTIKSGRDGISIELYDKMKALDALQRFASCMPKDWKQKIEEQKLKVMQEELEIKKKSIGIGEEIEDDGFIEAISKTAKRINWENE